MIYVVLFAGLVRLCCSGGMHFLYPLSFGCVMTLFVGIVTVVGTLKGYDQLMNLVLDDVKELLRGTFCPTLHPSPSSTGGVHTPAFINRKEHRLS